MGSGISGSKQGGSFGFSVSASSQRTIAVGEYNNDITPLIDESNNQLKGYRATLWLIENLNLRKNSKQKIIYSPENGKTLTIDQYVEEKDPNPIKHEKLSIIDKDNNRYIVWKPIYLDAEYGKAYVIKEEDMPKDVSEKQVLEDLIKEDKNNYPGITSILYEGLVEDYMATIKRTSDNLKEYTIELENKGADYMILLPLMVSESLFTTIAMFNEFDQNKIERASTSSSIFSRNQYVQSYFRDLFRKQKNNQNFELIIIDEVISGSSLNSLNANIDESLSQLRTEEIMDNVNEITDLIAQGKDKEVIQKYANKFNDEKDKKILELLVESNKLLIQDVSRILKNV